MKYLPLMFIPLVVLTAATYGYVTPLWWALVAIAFVPVQGLVWLLSRRLEHGWEDGEGTSTLVLWGALAAWPVWELAVVVGTALVLVQVLRGRPGEQPVHWFFIAAMILLPFVAELRPFRSGNDDVPADLVTHLVFDLTCGLVVVALLHHMRGPKPPKETSA